MRGMKHPAFDGAIKLGEPPSDGLGAGWFIVARALLSGSLNQVSLEVSDT
jgi:hypothetical protein